MDSEAVAGRDEFLRAYLAEHDEACPACGYSLRGLEGGRCPECGEALRLHVGLVEAKLGLWICGLVALAGGTGLTVFSFVAGMYQMIVYGPFLVPWQILISLGISLALLSVPLFLWLRGRRWFFERSRRARIGWTTMAWVWPMLVLGALIVSNSA